MTADVAKRMPPTTPGTTQDEERPAMPPAHVKALGASLLSNEIDSWMTGINTNVAGKQTRIINR